MKLWEQQSNESAKAYDAFRLYSEMGSDRSLEKVAKVCKKSVTLINRWSAEYLWGIRARAFDSYLADLERQMMESELLDRAKKWADRKEKLLEQEWATSEKLIDRAEEMLKLPLLRKTVEKDGQTIIFEPVRWTAATILNTLDLASKLGRLAVGEPTQRTESNATNKPTHATADYSRLSDPELETLYQLLEKAKIKPE